MSKIYHEFNFKFAMFRRKGNNKKNEHSEKTLEIELEKKKRKLS